MRELSGAQPPKPEQLFITDGGIETHFVFNIGEDLPNFSA